MKIWQKPAFLEICMNAEIGSYQEERDDERPEPPLRRPFESSVSAAGPAKQGFTQAASSPSSRTT